jgi:VWFA-related protein
MMRAILLLVVAMAGGAAAQAPHFRTRTDLVRIDVLVERDGRPITGLTAADFVVEDTGVVQRPRLVPASEAVSVSTLLDVSGSMTSDQLRKAAAAVSAIAAALRPGERHTSYAAAGDVTEIAVPAQGSAIDQVAGAIRERSGPRTSLFDALHVAIVRGARTVEPDLVLVLTDGHDNTSWLSASSVIDTAIRRETVICAVTIPPPSPGPGNVPPLADDAGPRLVGIIAGRTGGRVVHTDWSKELGPVFVSLLDAYRQRYILSFTPEGVPPDGKWHPIDVKLRRRAGRVHARDGYWSP